ncbi:T9SS type A sorting domain-containing protein [Flavobacteriaceae bacterium GSB9]|nr:T9SS type A sorting domain-containing protein [Flavobacteriaceae bacterium GSB9]
MTKIEDNGTVIWAKKIGGMYNDTGNCLTINDKALYVAGEFNSPMLTIGTITLINEIGTTPINNENGFLAKYLLDGSPVGAIAPENTGFNSFKDISSGNGTLYTAGYFKNSFILGNVTWSSETYKMFVGKINPETLGVLNPSIGAFLIYPNPAINVLTIQSEYNLNSHYQINNIMGQTIKHGILENQTIDVSSLPQGIYIISIGGFNVKFIKK